MDPIFSTAVFAVLIVSGILIMWYLHIIKQKELQEEERFRKEFLKRNNQG